MGLKKKILCLFMLTIMLGMQIKVHAFNGEHILNGEGFSWYKPNGLNSEQYRAVAYGSNKGYVIVGDEGLIKWSEDGIKWSKIKSPSTERIMDVTYSKGKFIAVGLNNTVLVSKNGRDWNQVPFKFGLNIEFFNSIASNGATFVAYSLSGNIFTSSDGEKWNLTTVNNEVFQKVIWINGYYSLRGTKTELTSKDGYRWTEKKIKETKHTYPDEMEVIIGKSRINIIDVVSTGKQFIAISDDGLILKSQDKKSWSILARQGVNVGEIYAILLAGKSFKAFSNNYVLTSVDGGSWGVKTYKVKHNYYTDLEGNKYFRENTELAPQQVAWNGSTYTAVVRSNQLYISNDGIEWIVVNDIVSLNTSIYFKDIIWDGKRFVAAGYSTQVKSKKITPIIATSYNGQKWTIKQINGFEGSVNRISYNGSSYVALGTKSKIIRSTNLTSWSKTNLSNNKNDYKDITATKGQFATISKNNVYYSKDGMNWSKYYYIQLGEQLVFFKNELHYVSSAPRGTGVFGQVDKKKYTEMRSSLFHGTKKIVADGKRIIIVGDNSKILVGIPKNN